MKRARRAKADHLVDRGRAVGFLVRAAVAADGRVAGVADAMAAGAAMADAAARAAAGAIVSPTKIIANLRGSRASRAGRSFVPVDLTRAAVRRTSAATL